MDISTKYQTQPSWCVIMAGFWVQTLCLHRNELLVIKTSMLNYVLFKNPRNVPVNFECFSCLRRICM